jgi:serine/threonine-protein kinase
MTPERWLRIEELFEAAVELTPEQRSRYLSEACGNDVALRRQVESLIFSSDDSDKVFEQAIRNAVAHAPAMEASLIGQHVGPYLIDGELGHGGMGTVYLARRDDEEYKKQVAIKLIRGGIATPDLLRRFRSERQILANLDHPNIARLLDGGTTESGTPYVVMDYVDGEPLDEYCDRSRLTTEARLALFRSVCAAIQYAHQNLVVHRDIKPGNILVTREGQPKLLDFGIAKLLADDEIQSRAETKPNIRLMTPEYASPEQVRGDQVTTASDVYSLGVLLYELLSGHRPYRFKSYTPLEVEQAVCSQEPERPSTAVGRDQEVATESGPVKVTAEIVSGKRGTTTDKLRRRLRGDLDNIVLMAMRKEPDRRYASAEQLSEDIRRHLEGLPVLARPSTLGYRTQKFLLRYRAATAAGVLVILVIAALIGFYTWRLAGERDRARLEAAKATRVSEFLTGLFRVADPSQSRGQSITAKEILDRGAAGIQLELAADPAVRASMMNVIGNTYESLGLYNDALPLLERALETRRQIHGVRSQEAAESLHDLARVIHFKGDYAAAESMFRDALQMQLTLPGAADLDAAETMSKLAETLDEKGALEESESLVRQALAIRRSRLGEEHSTIAESLNHLGRVLRRKRDFAAAEPPYRQALEMSRRLHGDVHPSVMRDLNGLGLLAREKGDPLTAEPLLRQALEVSQKLYGDENPQSVFIMNNLGLALDDNGKLEEAESLFRRALEIRRKLFGEEHPHVLFSTTMLGHFLRDRGAFEESELLLRKSVAIPRKLFGEHHPEVAIGLTTLGMLLVEKGDYQAARPVLREAVDVGRKALRPEHPYLTEALSGQAQVVLADGDPKTAERLLRDVLETQRRTLRAGHILIIDSQTALGASLLAQKRFDEAEPLLVASHSALASKRGSQGGASHWRTKRAAGLLATLYEGWGKPNQAQLYR